MKKPFTKDGIELCGTLETLSGVALVHSVEEDGAINYSGQTDIWWDGQQTVERNGQRVWVDDEGEEYLESEIEFREVADE